MVVPGAGGLLSVTVTMIQSISPAGQTAALGAQPEGPVATAVAVKVVAPTAPVRQVMTKTANTQSIRDFMASYLRAGVGILKGLQVEIITPSKPDSASRAARMLMAQNTTQNSIRQLRSCTLKTYTYIA
jgi:hypothetical protein